MKTIHKWIILCSLLFAAIASYSYGFSQGVFAFILIGVIFELTFWFNIFKTKKHASN
jgi:hypothetical protein